MWPRGKDGAPMRLSSSARERGLRFGFEPVVATLFVLCMCPDGSEAAASVVTLKSMSLEELLNVQVTTVSRQPERASRAAAAVHVITEEDIRRSGARSIPE